ncbi:MAG: hypothetical protein AB1733_03000 [Thermodesulfobacteriota bacterium]
MTYLFTKQGCGKCDWIKKKIDLDHIKDVRVMQLDEDDPEALAMLAYFECVTLSEKNLPILVSEENGIITGAAHIRKYLTENCC